MSVSPRLVYPLSQGSEAVCQLKTPLYMLGLGVSLVKQHFGTDERIALEKSKYLWKEDQSLSNLYVSYQDNTDYAVIGKRPAVIVSLGDTTFPRKVIGDRFAVDQIYGGAQFLDYSSASWDFVCIADKALDSLSLAGEVRYFFQTYCKYIVPVYGINDIRVEAIGRYQKQPDYKDLYGIVVKVGFDIQDNFEVDQEALKISAIKLNLTEANQ